MSNRTELVNNDTVSMTKFCCHCSRTDLLKKLGYVSHAVMKKAPLPVLEGVMLSAENGKISLTGYDLEFGVRTFVRADDTKGGSVVVPLKMFSEMLQSLTEDEITIEETEKNTLELRCGSAKCRLTCEPGKDFPMLPTVSGTQQFSLSAQQLVDMIHHTIFAVEGSHTSASEYVLFDLKLDELSLVACDGFRMAVQRETICCGMQDSITIPTETLKRFRKLFVKMDGQLTFQYDRQHTSNALAFIGDLQIFFRLACGKILDYKRYIPSGDMSGVVVSVNDLQRILKRCSLLKGKKGLHRVHLLIRKKEIILTCRSEAGSMEDIIPCEYAGEDITVEFDTAQFLSLIKESRSDQIVLVVYNEIYPVYLSPVDDNRRWFLLATMRPE